MKKILLAVVSAILASTAGSLFAAQAAVVVSGNAPASVISTTKPYISNDRMTKTLNLIPENALFAGFLNFSAIVNGQLFSEFIKTAEIDLDKVLAENECSRDDLEFCMTMFVSVDPADVSSVEAGGVILYAKDIQKKFADGMKQLEAMLKNKVVPANCIKTGIDLEGCTFEALKVDGKDAFLLTLPRHDLSVFVAAATENSIQYRLFIHKKPVCSLIPLRGQVNPMASFLNLNAGISFAVDGNKVRSLIPADPQGNEDPVLKSLHYLSFSAQEKENTLDAMLKADSDTDGVKLIQAQAQKFLEEMKNNPVTSVYAAATQIKVENVTTVVVEIPVPKQMLIAQIQAYFAMQKAQKEIEAAKQAETANPAGTAKPAEPAKQAE